jgi:hypothetical protein
MILRDMHMHRTRKRPVSSSKIHTCVEEYAKIVHTKWRERFSKWHRMSNFGRKFESKRTPLYIRQGKSIRHEGLSIKCLAYFVCTYVYSLRVSGGA